MPPRAITTATLLLLAACATGTRAPAIADPAAAAIPQRPVPHAITYPAQFRRAIERGTRTVTGEPGPRYWQQYARYDLTARLFPWEKRLEGAARIHYHNRSPDALGVVNLELALNLHAPGVVRGTPEEVTGGVTLRRVSAGGRVLADTGRGPRYTVEGTRLTIVPERAISPGDSIALELEWTLPIPRAGASGRMGWDADDVLFLAYWYPHVSVYDDVIGWHTDPFVGISEFYHGFADYQLTVEAPEGWLVMGTGELRNPEAVLAPEVLARLRRAESSDSIVAVLAAGDTGRMVTRTGTGGRLRWHFHADSVRDVAFSATRASRWDAARTPVGDRDGDGRAEYARVDALWRPKAPRWQHAARYAQHSIDFLSRYTGFPYPWPHMTAVEAGGILSGGMEFPMMTVIGDYTARGDSALYFVTAHELAHMWIPMIVGTNERRYAWIDEGSTTFAENRARTEFFPGPDHDEPDRAAYLDVARADAEGEIMRWSNFHYPGPAYVTASYWKPATVLAALRGVLGDETFLRAYRTFIERWAYKHPTPWDFFNTFESVSGRDLDWFWRTWYFETWTLDHAIASVTTRGGDTRIVVENRGTAPMPARLTITRSDGSKVEREIPVDTWLRGATSATVAVPAGSPVVRVELDQARQFPDIDRGNDVWTR